jgi:hypothetical protein
MERFPSYKNGFIYQYGITACHKDRTVQWQ